MRRLIIIFLILIGFSANAQMSYVVDSLLNEKDQIKLQGRVLALQNGSETDRYNLVIYYSNKGNLSKADSISNAIIEKFPFGMVAFKKAENEIIFENNSDKRNSLFQQVKKDYPSGNFDNINRRIALGYFLSGEFESGLKFADSIKSLFTVANISSTMVKVDSVKTEKYLKKYVDANPNRTTEGYYDLAAAYSNTLIKLGREKEARKYIEEAYENLPIKSKTLVTDYSFLLEKNKEYKKAMAILEKEIIATNGNPELRGRLSSIYGNLNPKADAQAYMASLLVKHKQVVKSRLLPKILDNTAPEFTLKDVDGKNVSLNDFKGKIMVVDFWATWCGPCKASFPVMQKVANSYKNDPNVKFLFIHTKEHSATPLEDAKAYLSENHYNFDLYMDTRNSENKNPAAAAFEVKGIPAKFVIDANSKIRFTATGFSYDQDEASVLELQQMIEIAKEAK
nr:redoxin domain-containing protein [Pedobacter panaciterrae]